MRSSRKDDGCEVSPSCLRCPLAACKYDDPLAYQRTVREARQAPTLLLLRRGVTVSEVSRRTGYSERTVHRLKAVAHGHPTP